MSFFVLQIMLIAQILVAQHYTVHFTEEAGISHEHSQGQHHDHDHHNHDKSDDVCQICLLAKGLNNGLAGATQIVPVVAVAFDPVISPLRDLKPLTIIGAYQARAPPAFS